MKREEFFHKLLNQAIAEAQISVLMELEKTITDKAQMIDNALFNDTATSIYFQSNCIKAHSISETRRILTIKERQYWKIAGMINKKIHEIRSN